MRHLHGTRDGRGRKRQHVHLLAQVLELLLVLHAKALLLVDDDQPQVARVHVARQQAMRAHEHLHLAGGKALQGGLLLFGAAETRENLHAHVERGKALRKRLEVLLGEDRRGAQHHDLLLVLRGLERGAQGDLGLAEAHVPAQQAVHRLGGLHVGLDVRDGQALVVGELVGEALLHLALPGAVGREGKALRGGAPGVEVDQVEGELLGGLARLGGGAAPVGGVQTREPGAIAVGAHVARDAVHLLERHVELVAVRSTSSRK